MFVFSGLENSPPLNQKRLLQMRKPIGGGYGFTLQVSKAHHSNGLYTHFFDIKHMFPTPIPTRRSFSSINPVDRKKKEKERQINIWIKGR